MSRKIWNFHGGIHPPQHKRVSTQTPIEQAPIPARLVMPLQQHGGVPAKPTVKPGDKVLRGDLRT